MLKKISEIFICEIKILRLQKQIRILENQGDSLALILKKEELLAQLQKNLQYPFGFKDMKQLAIAELKKDLTKIARPTKAQRMKSLKLSVTKNIDTIEV